jgi:hypothetical protein
MESDKDVDCALVYGRRPNSGCICAFHQYVKYVATTGISALDNVGLPEVKRRLTIDPLEKSEGREGLLTRTGSRFAKRIKLAATVHAFDKHVAAISKFLRLIHHLGTAPWASMQFDVNYNITMRLMAAHLQLISPGAPVSLLHIINPRVSLEGAQNLVWVTNRQQGKTCTLGRFIAALAISSPKGGLLATVYSTSLDRSIELVKSAKIYINWMATPAGRHIDYTFKYTANNQRYFELDNGVALNTIQARPKNPESCRGDAPWAAFFDEAGFMGAAFWNEFAFPLLQVRDRVFTCATTPAPPGSFFSTFVEAVQEQNAAGDFFFTSINHSLTCAPCLEAGDALECMHHLKYLPPWKSIVTLNQMAELAGDKEAYCTEVYGNLSSGASEYIPKALLAAAGLRERFDAVFNPAHVWVAIDPASHTKSDLGITAFAMNQDGMYIVLGLANVNVGKCETSQVQAIVSQFLKRLREHKLVGRGPVFVPIVECNGNEILAMSIVRAFGEFQPVHIPWQESNFASAISPGIGVWMTHDNKMNGIQATFQAFLDARVNYAVDMITADRTAYHPSARKVNPNDMIKLLERQLRSLRDQPDGSVSGKHQGNDDLACSFLLCVYWSMCARCVMGRN